MLSDLDVQLCGRARPGAAKDRSSFTRVSPGPNTAGAAQERLSSEHDLIRTIAIWLVLACGTGRLPRK